MSVRWSVCVCVLLLLLLLLLLLSSSSSSSSLCTAVSCICLCAIATKREGRESVRGCAFVRRDCFNQSVSRKLHGGEVEEKRAWRLRTGPASWTPPAPATTTSTHAAAYERRTKASPGRRAAHVEFDETAPTRRILTRHPAWGRFFQLMMCLITAVMSIANHIFFGPRSSRKERIDYDLYITLHSRSRASPYPCPDSSRVQS